MPGPFREPPFMDDGFDFRKLNNERVPAADPELFSSFMQDQFFNQFFSELSVGSQLGNIGVCRITGAEGCQAEPEGSSFI